MRNFWTTLFFFTISTGLFGQTAIDQMMKKNLEYLEKREVDGFEFRSQIITEFNDEYQQQSVNIELSSDFTYHLVAMGDSDVKAVSLSVSGSPRDELKELDEFRDNERISVFNLMPAKSGSYTITIQVREFSNRQKGFVSFMVLRK